MCLNAYAQSNLDNVLLQIRANNKSLQANVQFWEAQKLQFKTSLTPNNPTVEYDFLSGSPANAGNQHDFSIVQQFDFPTTYKNKSKLAIQQTAQADFALNISRQDILIEAKKYCIELVYHNKLQLHLAQQKQNTEIFYRDFQIKLEKGDGTILDVNKAKLQLIEINKEYQENGSAITQLNQKLTELNGGIEISLFDTLYPIPPLIPDFKQLESEYEIADPLRKNLEQQITINQRQLDLSKSLRLPKLELGYHYQGILGQTYHGVHTGISLPIWENKNMVKQKQAQLLFSELQLNAHTNEHYYHIKHMYEEYSKLKITLQEYQSALKTINSIELLNKAIKLGEISTIEYFMEINYYNNAIKNYLQMENEYYQIIAELFKYKL